MGNGVLRILRASSLTKRKSGGRGRSRTHQALCQHLTGFEGQAPHRGRRSSENLITKPLLDHLRVRNDPSVSVALGDVNTVKKLE
jgi:hypothetical protein